MYSYINTPLPPDTVQISLLPKQSFLFFFEKLPKQSYQISVAKYHKHAKPTSAQMQSTSITSGKFQSYTSQKPFFLNLKYIFLKQKQMNNTLTSLITGILKTHYMCIAANISWHPKPHIGKTIITQPTIYPCRWNNSVGERDRNRNVRESQI